MEQEWHVPLRYRVGLVISAAGFERWDKPADVELDLYGTVAAASGTWTPGVGAMRVVEVNAQGNLLDLDVPFQFDANADGSTGTLIVLLAGFTPAQAVRHFYVYFDHADEGCKPVQVPALVSVSDAGVYEGQESLRISTPEATYLYHVEGGGLASLLDRDGNDWISYHPEGGSAGHFRGIPNMGECAHPGYTNSYSRVINSGPLKARILSEGKEGGWAFTWDFYPSYAVLTVLRMNGPYRFLYEGTPGGKLDEESGFCLRSNGVRTPASEIWDEHIPDPAWVCFGNGRLHRVFYAVRHETDPVPDQYWPMEHNMTVFGFGRKYQSRQRFLTRTPAHFTIGLADHVAYAGVQTCVNSAYRALGVTIGPPEARK